MDIKIMAALRNVSKPAALVSITWVRGSTPCKPGSKMLVLADGTTLGSIGGGYGEAKVVRYALMAISSRTSCKYKVNMGLNSEDEEQVMGCGIMEVLIEVISEKSSKLLQAYIQNVEEGVKPVLITVVNTPEHALNTLGDKLMMTIDGKTEGALPVPKLELLARFAAKNYWLGNKFKSIRINLSGQVINQASDVSNFEWEVMIEPPPDRSELIILGGGHVALAVAKLATALDFRLVVIDDRPDYANKERFSMVDNVICAEFTKGLSSLNLGADSYVIIATRGHHFDKECFRQVISYPLAYLGIVASPGRAQTFLHECLDEGYPLELLEKVHSPIGLDLGAETLDEIALSIMSEIMKVRRGSTGLSLSQKRKQVSPKKTNLKFSV